MGSASTIKGNTGTPAALAAATTPLATAAAKVASYQACIRLVHAYRYPYGLRSYPVRADCCVLK